MGRIPKTSDKIATGSHGTFVEGIFPLLEELASWPEVQSIRVGRIRFKKGRTRERAGGPAPIISLHASRPEIKGSKVIGIKCSVVRGNSLQEVILVPTDFNKLKSRLQQEGMCGEW